MNLAYSLGDEVSRTCVIFAMCCAVGGVVGFMIGGVGRCRSISGIIHSPVLVHLLPHSIVRPLYLIVHPILLNVTSQPALQRLTTEMRECDARLGSMWACRACSGRASMSNLHVCVVQMRSPFGSWARMGAFVGCLSVKGAVVVRKWLLAPESTIAQSHAVLSLSEMVLSNDVWVGVELCVGSVTDALLINCLFLHKMFAPNRQYWYPW